MIGLQEYSKVMERLNEISKQLNEVQREIKGPLDSKELITAMRDLLSRYDPTPESIYGEYAPHIYRGILALSNMVDSLSGTIRTTENKDGQS